MIPLLCSLSFAHSDVHSSTRLFFHSYPPTVQTSWGFLFSEQDEWLWVCPEVLSQPSLYNLAIDQSGGWWIASVGGLYYSSDHCNFDLIGFEDTYITQIEIDTENKIWLSSASGYQENTLWVSENNGETFESSIDLGENTRIYSFAKQDSHTWLIGDKDQQPYAWYQNENNELVEISLSEDLWLNIVAIDPNNPTQIWLQTQEELSELYLLDSAGTFDFKLEAESSFNALLKIEERFILSSEKALFYSENQGDSWQKSSEKPETACLKLHEGFLYTCTHNWNDEAAVMRTYPIGTPETWNWESVLWFGDVQSIANCESESDVETYCSPLWDGALLNAGFAQSREDMEETTTNGCMGSQKMVLIVPLLLFSNRRKKRKRNIH